ncbi:hypothetical protein HD806DRAFT_490791 [Xylariaceae sp. AK1471]|nr:hypothetical protein HD806DRAFT_490791 [Xylariaceae sp. AK1471]
MAELAFIGLASNILQFLQLGINLAAEARELYKSASGTTIINAQLEADAEELRSLMEQLQTPDTSLAPSIDKTKAEKQLSSSVKSCIEVSNMLLRTLDGLKVKDAHISKLKAIKQVFSNESKRDKVNQLHSRLQDLQDSTMLRIIVVLRDNQSTISRSINKLIATNNRLEAKTMQKLEDMIHQDILKHSKGTTYHDLDKALENTKDMRSLITMIRKTQLTDQNFNTLSGEIINVQKQQKILKSLRFPEIRIRHESIKAAHFKTFQWIFDSQGPGFVDWLEAGEGIYWIRGKAGSGKSTLMRFLVEHPETAKTLSKWASERKLVIASHFFWYAGNAVQKSREGLFRTLLFQILRQIPDLIETLFPSRWSSADADLDMWSEDELVQALKKLPLESGLPFRFCVFVDGLDEYTAGAKRYHGDYQELINLLLGLSTSPVIKVCISSRPWTPFDRAFGKSKNKIQLEDLTKDDIKVYVLDRFQASGHFQALARADPRCKALRDSIVEKAQGVFLWVYLVIDSLLRGASSEDNFDDLQLRLNQIPAGLEEYFKLMLDTIEPVYWEQTIRIFRITMDAGQPLPLLAYEFLDHERTNQNYAVDLSTEECSKLNLQDIQNRTKIRLNARCKDLLEAVHDRTGSSFMSWRVNFLHRTVRDFFLETDFLDNMMKERNTNFDSLNSLSRVMLALVKVSHTMSTDLSKLNMIFGFTDSLMHYVRRIERDITGNARSILNLDEKRRVDIAHALLDELDQVNSSRMSTQDSHWTNIRDPAKGQYQEYKQKTFLASTIEARLLLYVTTQLDADPGLIQRKKGRPLLDYALRPAIVTPSELTNFEEGPDAPLVKLLLSRKADPNKSVYIYDSKSLWHLFLSACKEHAMHKQRTRFPDLYETMHLMISNGADCNYISDIDNILELGLSRQEAQILRTIIDSRRSELPSSVAWLSKLFSKAKLV